VPTSTWAHAKHAKQEMFRCASKPIVKLDVEQKRKAKNEKGKERRGKRMC
jgi:hypothetical protein